MKSVVKPLAKIALMLIGLTAAISATDAAIQKKKKRKSIGSGTAASIISNKEILDIMKIVYSF